MPAARISPKSAGMGQGNAPKVLEKKGKKL
jgi:hypothetical protein